MPKYLITLSYTAEGAKGLMKDGGTKRKQVAEQLIKAVGGKLEALYFAFGAEDGYLICDAPDNASVAAVSLTVAGSGAIRTKTTVLVTPEELDQASKKSISYKPPGT